MYFAVVSIILILLFYYNCGHTIVSMMIFTIHFNLSSFTFTINQASTKRYDNLLHCND